ncbi:MAG: hypothetical protein IPO81_30165 [Kouleothrix sp.]|nr:hypothetical protein [Kouleothrix sp.]
MRKILPPILLGGALLLGACGGPATTGTASTTTADTGIGTTTTTTADTGAGTTTTATSGADMSTTATADTGADMSTTATSDTGDAMAATAISGAGSTLNDAATAVADALSAVVDDQTLQQGQALVLDATQSAGNITDYKWTIVKAPAGAESVEGQVIREGSSGNISLEPADYAKYFPTAGSYTVRLTVTDASGGSSSDDFTIDVP